VIQRYKSVFSSSFLSTLPPSLPQELVRATNRYLEAPSPASLLVRYVFPPSPPPSFPTFPSSDSPHRVRLVNPVILTPISLYFQDTYFSDQPTHPSLPLSLPSSLPQVRR